MEAWLKKEWTQLISAHTDNNVLVFNYWTTIELFYTAEGRHYHNLNHIYNLLLQAEAIKEYISDYDALRFAIWYHDIICKATKGNNETKSAEFAINQLKATNFSKNRMEIVQNLIKSTQKHKVICPDNTDNAFLLDMDLSILGNDWSSYQSYIQNIRKEYAIYPDLIYKSGRKKVLQQFLKQERIYITKHYFERFEKQARLNIERELLL
ncbi:HD domain-containing protein [Subsaximicrobium wynnwilliamsii]|uniref:HD domain-containing protein n=1 Tax=Subsaximicrobium wynnwilliamsii TaxID=291179 RepID=UPI001CB916EA|nr:hypothetical protein [Subsaximicrobium wynnwilliamsii]